MAGRVKESEYRAGHNRLQKGLMYCFVNNQVRDDAAVFDLAPGADHGVFADLSQASGFKDPRQLQLTGFDDLSRYLRPPGTIFVVNRIFVHNQQHIVTVMAGVHYGSRFLIINNLDRHIYLDGAGTKG